MRYGNRSRHNNNRARGQQGQGRSNSTNQIAQTIDRAFGKLSNQLSKSLRAGQAKPQQGNQPSKGRKVNGKAASKDARNSQYGKTRSNRDQGNQVRGGKGKGLQAWIPSAKAMPLISSDCTFLVAVIRDLVPVIGKSVGFEAPVVEIRYEIEKHLSERANSDRGKVEVDGFKAELRNTESAFNYVATLAVLGAIPTAMVQALFNKVSDRDILAIQDLNWLSENTGGMKNGIKAVVPFEYKNGTRAVESALELVDVNTINKLTAHSSDPFEAVSKMMASPFDRLCAYVGTTPAEIASKARAREASMAIAGPSRAKAAV